MGWGLQRAVGLVGEAGGGGERERGGEQRGEGGGDNRHLGDRAARGDEAPLREVGGQPVRHTTRTNLGRGPVNSWRGVVLLRARL